MLGENVMCCWNALIDREEGGRGVGRYVGR